MPYLLLAGVVFYVVMSRRGAHFSAPRPPFWGPGAPQAPSPQVPAPLTCMNQHLPQQREIPQAVTDRAKQLLASALPLGAQTVEQIGNQVWRFQVETHGANELNPQPHRGVGVRLCV